MKAVAFPLASPVLVIGAHPDDETIAAGGSLSAIEDVRILILTDGAPRTHSNPAAYARQRNEELLSAMALAGIGENHITTLGIRDQECSFQLALISLRIADILSQTLTAHVLVHPYEGGHPDHDAAAFAVDAACRLLTRRGLRAPAVFEYTSYHNATPHDLAPTFRAGEFLCSEPEPELCLTLSQDQAALKRRMFDCYASQKEMLAQFAIGTERFRKSPRYNFQAPPHPGTIYYDSQNWGITGEQWREHAVKALEELNLNP